MNAANAEMLLYAITAVAVVVWVEGLRFLVSTVRKDRKGGEEFGTLGNPAPANIIYGSAEVKGGAAELLKKAAAVMAARSIRICETTDETIVFETPTGLNAALPPLNGQMRFIALSPQTTRVDYAVAKPYGHILLTLGFVFQAFGLAAIIAGFLLIYFLAVPNPNPGARWMTILMILVFNFLWPPFLHAGLYRRSISIVRAQLDTFIHNLPFLTA